MNQLNLHPGRPTSRFTGVGVLAVVLAFSAGACGDLLEVNDPDIVSPGDLSGETGAAVRYAGAIGDFRLAYVNDFFGSVVIASGLLSDELYHSGTFPGFRAVDLRNVTPATQFLADNFQAQQRARAALEGTAGFLQELAAASGQPDPRADELLALAGFTYVGLAELYCSGVPISTATETGELVLGEPQTTAALLQTAVQRFDAALGTADPQLANLARVGKARAQLDLADFSGAAATTAAVPDAFAYLLTFAISSGDNQFYNLNTLLRRVSVADREGGNGLDFRTAGDPRVPVTQEPMPGFDQNTPSYQLLAYAITGDALGRETSFPLASGIEARLIEAEAALQAGNAAGAFVILNQLRAGAGLAALLDPGTAEGRTDVLFRERAFWLYATGHRLGDLRRLVRQYGRAASSVFPVGTHISGMAYGTDVNLPVPVEEENNPNFNGCLNRDA